MSESSEENAPQKKGMAGMRKVAVAYCFKCVTGVVLIILGAIASGYPMKNSGRAPYFIGAFLTGIAMSLIGIINFRNWQSIKQGNASLRQKTMCVGIETGISILSVILGFIGLIIVGVSGLKAPLCVSLFGSCSNYKDTSSYKLAVAILVFLIVSIIINIVYFMILWVTFKRDGVSIFKGRSNQYPQNRHRERPLQGVTYQTSDAPIVINSRHGQPEPYGGAIIMPGVSSVPHHPANISGMQAGPIVINSRHGQPEAYGGAIIQPGVSSVPHRPANSSGMQDGPIVLNTRHGQPEPYGGAILHPGVSNAPNQSGYVTSTQDQGPIVLNYRHGQPEPFAGAIISRPGGTGNASANGPHGQQQTASTGYVLGTHHGQPQPFDGAVLSTPTQHSMSDGNHRLVSELQEQNRLLREQLALQQQQRLEQPKRTAEPSAPVDDSPPNYEECMADPAKIKYLEEQNRHLKSRFQKHEKELAGNPSAPSDKEHHPNPSAPPM